MQRLFCFREKGKKVPTEKGKKVPTFFKKIIDFMQHEVYNIK